MFSFVRSRGKKLLSRKNSISLGLMHRSLLLLSKLRLQGQWRKLRRTLSTPKGFFLAVVAVGFFGLTLLPYLLTRGLPTAVPKEHMPLMTWFMHPAALFAFWVFSFVGSHFKSPIAFSMPEVEFLFPGPFTRRELLVFKLTVSTLGTLGFSIMMPLIMPMVWGPAALVGIWLALTFMQWTAILVTLGASWLGERYRLVLGLVVLALVSAVALSVWQSDVMAEGVDLRDRLLALESSTVSRSVLAPFAVFSRVMGAQSLSELFRWSAPALAMVVLVGIAILTLDRFFVEASLEASQRRYEVMERLKRTGGMPTIGARSKPRMGLVSFPRLGGIGPIAWRQSLEMFRGSGRLLLALPAVIAPFAAAVAASSQRTGTPPDALVIALTLITGFMITTMMQLGLRNDLDHVDVIKTLPLSSQRIVWGSIGASILYITLVQLVAVAAMVIALRQWVPAAAGALALALPINVLTVATDSSLVLLFPSIRRFTPGDVLVGVRMVLVNFAKVVFAALAASIAGLVFVAGRLLFHDAPLAAFGLAWLVLFVEGLATVWLAAYLFKHYDPSEHLLDGD